MGGDDLDSDDEYLVETDFVSTGGRRGTAITSSSSGDEDEADELRPRKQARQQDQGQVKNDETEDDAKLSQSKKKRKTDSAKGGGGGDNADALPSSKKRKNTKNANGMPSTSRNLLVHAGRGIANDGPESQATFLTACYTHALKMKEGDDDDDDGDGGTFAFEPKHLGESRLAPDDALRGDLTAYLKSGPLPSTKRLKNWKYHYSPMILIVTISARRAVGLLKDLAPLKLRCAKLFAKHMVVREQAEMLEKQSYGIAVGTPGRLLALLRRPSGGGASGAGGGSGGDANKGALRLNRTELIVLDCQEDGKGFTVCTSNDTAPDLMAFMKESVVPEIERRSGKIKVAMF